MTEIIKSMRIVKMYCWESAFSKKVRLVRKLVLFLLQSNTILLFFSLHRREIIQCAFRLLLDCIQTLLAHTFTNVGFLLMYATMWSLNTRFDTKFFAVSMCMLGHLRVHVVHQFTMAVRNLVNYLAAQRRIQVSLIQWKFLSCLFREKQTFLLLDESKRDERLLSTSYLDLVPKSNTVENGTCKERSPRITCNISRALWEKVSISVLALYSIVIFLL